ncbi:MAG: hypothetical protein EXS36_09595 [Pedosphaera sp.]|nr:hypothetical protein [Pedosphaera sp.]
MLVHMLGNGETLVDRGCRLMVEQFGLPKRFLRTNSVPPSLNVTRALAAFHTLGQRAAPAADSIIPLLNRPDTAVKAIAALVLIRPERKDQILSLTNVTRIRRSSRAGHTPDQLLSVALLALGSFGPKASGAIPFLIDSLSSTNENVKAAAAVALVRIGAPAEKVVPRIVASLPTVYPALREPQRGGPQAKEPLHMNSPPMQLSWTQRNFLRDPKSPKPRRLRITCPRRPRGKPR